MKQLLRGGISYEYRKRYEVPYKEIWQTLEILIVTSERMNWLISGYIIGNLLKHKEVSAFNELKQNQFSSYWYMVEKYGDKEMRDLVYSVINVDEKADGPIQLNEFDNINYNGLKSVHQS